MWWQVEELIKSKLEKPKTLRQLAARQWHEIDHGTHIFERPDVECAELRRLSKEDLTTFFEVPIKDPPGSQCLRRHAEAEVPGAAVFSMS